MTRNRRTTAIATLFALTLLAGGVQAQQADYRFGGLTFNRDLMMAWDFSDLSRPQPFGTARAMGMGGAFVSLGADQTSMALNPAGLGMYRHNELSITPLVTLARSETAGTAPWASNNKNQFALANFGVVFNVLEQANRPLTSLSIGFGLNRTADFNSRCSYSVEDRYDGAMVPSIADVYAEQMNLNNIFPEQHANGGLNGLLDYRNPYFWPAVLAYKSAMTHVIMGADGPMWEADAIGPRASILRSVDLINSGSINEFNLSVGANINNLVYLGGSLGVCTVSKTSELVYGEKYNYSEPGDGGYAYGPDGILPAQLKYADLWQRTKIEGAGVNFKLGVVVRPTPALRIGAAIHTPTYYSLERSYQAGMEYSLLSNDGREDVHEQLASPVQYDEERNSWDFVSPTRLMFGVSYTFGKTAILSVDYERDWYNGIRVKNVPAGADFSPEHYKADFKNNFCASNTLRAGVEIRPLPLFALRAGYGYTSSMLKDESLAYEVPQTTTCNYFSLGAGWNVSRSLSLDVAYMQMNDTQSRYQLFYMYDQNPVTNPSGEFALSSGTFESKLTRHFLTLSLGIHF